MIDRAKLPFAAPVSPNLIRKAVRVGSDEFKRLAKAKGIQPGLSQSDVAKALSYQGVRPVDENLRDFAISFANTRWNYVCDEASTLVGVRHMSGLFQKDMLENYVTPRAGAIDQFNELPTAFAELESDTYRTRPYGLQSPHNELIDAETDGVFTPEEMAAAVAVGGCLQSKEQMWINTCMKESAWDGKLEGVASNPTPIANLDPYDSSASNRKFVKFTAGAADADPFNVLLWSCDLMKRQLGVYPTHWIVGADVIRNLVDTPDMIAKISGGATTGQPAFGSLDLITDYIRRIKGIELRILEIDALSAVGTPMNTSDGLLVHLEPSGTSTLTAIARLSWLSWKMGSDVSVDTYEEPSKFTELTRAAFSVQFKVLMRKAGIFMKGVV